MDGVPTIFTFSKLPMKGNHRSTILSTTKRDRLESTIMYIFSVEAQCENMSFGLNKGFFKVS